MTWTAGQSLQNGKYVIDSVLGEGGFAVTYKARDINGRYVAIKTLNDRVQQGPDFEKLQQDFLNEALKILKCRHPHIVEVYEVIQEGGLWCMVMECINGEDLASRVGRELLSEREALQYIQQIGEALIVVHSQGLLHRDVKPENIMLRSDKSQAVLIDFGIAREFTHNVAQTQTSYRTDYYAPIEQYENRAKRGAYTDVYALAATLYFILTGQLPTSAPSRAAGTSLMPPKQHNRSIADKVNRGILKGMALRAKDRPQSIPEWLNLLGLESSVTTAETGKRAWFGEINSWAIGIAATVVATFALDYVVAPLLIKVPVVGEVVLRICKAADANCGDQEDEPETAAGEPTESSGMVPPSTPSTTPSTRKDVRWSSAIAPNGNRMVVGDNQGNIMVLKLDPFELTDTLRGHAGRVNSVAIDPDNKILVSGGNDRQIILWDWRTKKEKSRISEHSGAVNSVALSPDNKMLASGSSDKTIKLWDMKNGKLKHTLTGHSGQVNSVAISPDGKIVASGSDDNTIKLWNLQTGQLLRTITGHSGRVNSVAISPDGNIVASGSDDNTIKLWNLQTGDNIGTLTGNNQPVVGVVFSPDGQTIASGSDSEKIKLWNVSSRDLKRTINGHSGYVNSAVFTPNSKVLVISIAEGNIKIIHEK